MKKFSLLVAVMIFFTAAMSAKNNIDVKPVKGNVSKYQKFKNQKALKKSSSIDPRIERKVALKK